MHPIGIGIILVVVWIGTPLYWGWMHFSLWLPVIWTIIVVALAIVAGWRTASRGLIISFLAGLCFGAMGVFPIYFLARLLSGLVN